MTPERARTPWWALGLAVRVVLLALLLWGVLVAALRAFPAERTLEDFRAAAGAGRVTHVDYREQDGDVYQLTWAEGSPVWRRAQGLSTGDGPEIYSVERLHRDLGANRPGLAEPERDSDANGFFPDWPFDTSLSGIGWWVGAAWVAAFLIMIGSTPRLGNRWAWFWLFTAGQFGALLFLLLEPRPLWFGPEREPAPRKRWDGGTGCLFSIGLGLAAMAAAVALGRLTDLLLG
ncbi:hypothetical protein PS9374_05813 [Planomonospora sphaerica]|uniref:Uncharacterized protein n=1 Tax=Planomonospora sphaerica TaxID=161355 RepID=A0A161ME53_9ACTN|nr:hypothetical protein [Planomonospora sphaerica]GAT70133.1 hypothetical protein PS9374_05813 [Planomonospora sphaerica]